MHRRRFFSFAAGLAVLGCCGGCGGPDRPFTAMLTLIVPAARGHGWDPLARGMAAVAGAEGLARAAGVENRPGGPAGAALEALASHGAPYGSPSGTPYGSRSGAPSGPSSRERSVRDPLSREPFSRDGRLLLAGMPAVAGAEIADTAAVVDSTTPLARLAGDWAALIVLPGSRLRSFEDLAALLRRDPGGLVMGGRLEGGSDHVLYGMIAKCLGADARLLQYAGYPTAADAVEALRDGRVGAILGSARSFTREIAAGRLRPLVVSSAERLPGIDAPTLMEMDVRLEYTDWCGVFGPRGMSPDDRDRAVALCDALDASPRWRSLCEAGGWSRIYLSGDDFRQWLSGETGRARDVLRDLGLLKAFATTCWGSCVRSHYM
ncbi:tripartite tricarboxylate transporter substrate-binding protein [Streptosporangium sp. NPDC048047]|uniref:Bug family tripartite tricarboxylate transporter substrate binding protein n=1 Tax=Streptosporangium sp. NPDC048047 TaxID=3155748 RepID=UPI0034487764